MIVQQYFLQLEAFAKQHFMRLDSCAFLRLDSCAATIIYIRYAHFRAGLDLLLRVWFYRCFVVSPSTAICSYNHAAFVAFVCIICIYCHAYTNYFEVCYACCLLWLQSTVTLVAYGWEYFWPEFHCYLIVILLLFYCYFAIILQLLLPLCCTYRTF